MAMDFDLVAVEVFQFKICSGRFRVTSVAVQRTFEGDDLGESWQVCCLHIMSATNVIDDLEMKLLLASFVSVSDLWDDLDAWRCRIEKKSDRFSIDIVFDLSSSDADFKNQVILLLHELSSIFASCPDLVVYGVTADAPAWVDCKFIHHLIQGNVNSIAHQAMQMYRLHVLAMSPFALACCDRSDMGDFFGTPENPSLLAEGWWIEGERRFEPKTVEDAKLIQNACAMMAVPERLLPNGGRWLGNALAHRGSKQPGLAPDQEPSPLIHVMNRTGLLMEEMPSATARIGVQVVCKMS